MMEMVERVRYCTAQKMMFSIKDFLRIALADLVTFTEEIINGKLHFLLSVVC